MTGLYNFLVLSVAPPGVHFMHVYLKHRTPHTSHRYGLSRCARTRAAEKAGIETFEKQKKEIRLVEVYDEEKGIPHSGGGCGGNGDGGKGSATVLKLTSH